MSNRATSASTTYQYVGRLYGIRDPETRKALMLSPKATIAETVGFALTIEAVQTITRSSLFIRQMN